MPIDGPTTTTSRDRLLVLDVVLLGDPGLELGAALGHDLGAVEPAVERSARVRGAGSDEPATSQDEQVHRARREQYRGIWCRAMIDHIGVSGHRSRQAASRSTRRRSRRSGYALMMKWEQFAGFGVGGKPDFWIGSRRAEGRDPRRVPRAAAARRSARSTTPRSPPAARTTARRACGAHYHEHYYGAFVLDPDGHNIEAVCHEPFLG